MKDKTGPQGMGPGTGRGMGSCGRGAVGGLGRGRGYGRAAVERQETPRGEKEEVQKTEKEAGDLER